MSLSLPKPGPGYDASNEAEARRALEKEDKKNRKTDNDVDIGDQKLLLRSPNGARWSITVSNTGVITALAL